MSVKTIFRYNSRLILLIAFILYPICLLAVDPPCKGRTTTSLNARTGPGTNYRRITTLEKGTEITILRRTDNGWLKISVSNYLQPLYVSAKYVELSPGSQEQNSRHTSWSIWSVVWFIIKWTVTICVWLFVLYWVGKILLYGSVIFVVVFTVFVKVVSFPFFITNALQRYLAKPWFVFYKRYQHSDSTNETLRKVFSWIKIPLWVTLTPVRFANAVFFNIVTHCFFELWNYILEVIIPTDDEEGADGLWTWIYMLPVRIIKYPLWHGSLTILESLIWTVADTILPALTVFHGTSADAADNIVASPGRIRWRGKYNVGMFMVGGGNWAGNGIYFAPARSTATHYSSGSMIVCRVTFGKTLDLGLAPWRVYNACGHPNALIATDWGLKNGYVTGEWWRGDEGWWEYCMYDWQNRYNISWRIRPLYVIDMESGNIQRIPGGMGHWLFRRQVIKDIMNSIFK